MLRDEAKPLLERFLNAVTAMAVAQGPLNERLASVTETVGVFPEAEIPKEIRAQYNELVELLHQPTVPKDAENHREFVKRMSAYYLSPTQAEKASDLIISMFRAIVYASDEE